ncbi:MAG: aminotransferase class V-fold PLP-dependent enzyme [Gemmatimonadaceae bacterium]
MTSSASGSARSSVGDDATGVRHEAIIPVSAGTPPALDVATLRAREFPWMDEEGGAYLNSASTGPLPVRTVDTVTAWARRRQRPHAITMDEQFGILRTARGLCARLIGADASEIALAANTSEGINLAARALPLGPGDVIVASDGEFPANVYPWMAVAGARGAELRLLPRAGDGPDEDALVAALDDPRVRVLAVSWVAFATGHRVDLARLGRECRARDVYFVVDAIQGVGAAPLDVHACHVDVLAAGCQKWLLSPWGTGFTFVRRELAERLTPPAAGWLSVEGAEDFSRLTRYDMRWRNDAARFEVGTMPFEILAAMNSSLELLLELGIESIGAHVAALAGRIVGWAEAHPEVRLLTPSDPARRAGIVSLVPADGEAAARLTAAGVAFSPREGAVRLAPHCFNTVADVNVALRALEG